jgi:hypothetical protein
MMTRGLGEPSSGALLKIKDLGNRLSSSCQITRVWLSKSTCSKGF